MTANKHTRGPWEVAEKFNCVDVRGVDGPYIANCNQSVAIDWRTKEANARLIAAAPELLEFIQHAAKHLEAGINEYPGSPEEPPQPASQWDYEAGQLVGELRRLMAKATGGAA